MQLGQLGKKQSLSLKLNLNANRSMSGETPSLVHAALEGSLSRPHSVDLVNVLDSLSASVLSTPGMRAMVSQTSFSKHQFPDLLNKRVKFGRMAGTHLVNGCFCC